MSEFRVKNGIITPIMYGEKKGWQGEVRLKNGQIIDMSDISYVSAYNPFVGLAVEYGLRKDVPYDQFMINERFGGGNGVGVFFQRDGHIYVGMTQEKRNGGQLQWELPRFFCGTRNETRMESFQENLEKDRFSFQQVKNMDVPVNCNSAYNYTANDTEGLQLFYVEIEYNPEILLYAPEEDTFVFHDLMPIERDKSTKKIVNSMFFEIDTLCANQDVFTSAWVGKFWTYVRKGIISLKF
ncbi:MAG: hypothetical protein PHX34_00625 [Candidatus Shapirobacteria bacterium]|nr:hypothetical protein [Candidatus Shapirobacteria bacterium]